ncbi:MAG: hypothetical protein ACE5IY_17480 [bacterium]
MNKLSKWLLGGALVILISFPVQSEAGVGVYVKLGPPKARRVKVVKPAKPYRHAVWVAGHYQHKNGRTVWVNGVWIKHKVGFVYVQPHWKKTPHGYWFVPGHWVKK